MARSRTNVEDENKTVTNPENTEQDTVENEGTETQNEETTNEKENNKNVEVNNMSENKTEAKKVKMVKVTIPKDQLNDENTFVPVSINGKIWQINRGVEVEVPQEVKNILKEAGYIS